MKASAQSAQKRYNNARQQRRKKFRRANGPSVADADKPVIRLRAGALHESASQAEAALIGAGVPFYARGGEIVHPIVEEVAAFKRRRTKVVRIKAVTVDLMRDYLSRVARFEKYSARARKVVAADPPPAVAKIILARDGEWGFKPLAGIITTPTLRPDGSVLGTPGYDPATRLLLLAPPDMPARPEPPTRPQAEAALELLSNLLEEFPFVDAASRAVGLSALMTPVVRGAMQVAPMHAFDAPEAGTGKSYMIDVASAIATGEIAPVIAAGRNEEETEKRLAAELMTGQPIVSIDNFNGDLSGDFLCQAIERPTIKPRILGRSETRRIENTVSMYANGNNMRLVGDIVRRVIRSSLDANMERPELREFKSDPVATVLADRGRYIAAILTIVRAYLVADCPNLLRPLASFSDWSRLVRSALVWLGCTDPVRTMEAARDDDPLRGNLRTLVAAWLATIGPDNPKSVGDLISASKGTDDLATAFHRALLAVARARDDDGIDPPKLGRWLARNKGRVVDGSKIVGVPDKHSKQSLWVLQDTSAVNLFPDPQVTQGKSDGKRVVRGLELFDEPVPQTNGGGQNGSQPKPKFGGASVGDLIQWESGGALQFKLLRRVQTVSDDRQWVFVEGSRTGIPMAEVIVNQQPPDAVLCEIGDAEPNAQCSACGETSNNENGDVRRIAKGLRVFAMHVKCARERLLPPQPLVPAT